MSTQIPCVGHNEPCGVLNNCCPGLLCYEQTACIQSDDASVWIQATLVAIAAVLLLLSVFNSKSVNKDNNKDITELREL